MTFPNASQATSSSPPATSSQQFPIALRIKCKHLIKPPSGGLTTPPLSPSHLCSRHTSLLAAPPTHRAPSYPRTFAQAVPSAWIPVLDLHGLILVILISLKSLLLGEPSLSTLQVFYLLLIFPSERGSFKAAGTGSLILGKRQEGKYWLTSQLNETNLYWHDQRLPGDKEGAGRGYKREQGNLYHFNTVPASQVHLSLHACHVCKQLFKRNTFKFLYESYFQNETECTYIHIHWETG